MSNKFAHYVAEVEANGTAEDRERLNAYREHFEIARQLIELRKAKGPQPERTGSGKRRSPERNKSNRTRSR